MSDSQGAVRRHHPLRPPLPPAAPGAPAWPTFTGTATLVGASSSGVTVYVDQTLGDPGLQNANSLLSRWCAAAVSGDALSDFATAPAWAQAGMPDWVNRTEQTDQDAVSTGCGMAFISWLLSQGQTLSQIAQAMVALGDPGTLATLYARLTGDAATNAWTKFQAAVGALPSGITTDDPFNGMSSAMPAPTSP
jgi:hypothetical protein